MDPSREASLADMDGWIEGGRLAIEGGRLAWIDGSIEAGWHDGWKAMDRSREAGWHGFIDRGRQAGIDGSIEACRLAWMDVSREGGWHAMDGWIEGGRLA